MVTCSVNNSSSISCDHGCCGTDANRICCVPTISETVVIVVCVVGALIMVAVVVALIVCITHKQKNRVTRIRPQRQHNRNSEEPRTRRVVIPKPPPYSEAPPNYEAMDYTSESRSNARSTEPIIRNDFTIRETTVPSNQRYQQGRGRDRPYGTIPSDAPPSYTSIFRVGSNIPNRIDSPEPGPSGIGSTFTQRRMVVETALERHPNETPFRSVLERTRNGSPHPSLASGRISSSMIHRTTSERSRFETPLDGSNSRRQLLDRGNNSVTPVTIREITVHSHSIPADVSADGHDTHNSKGNKKKQFSKLPKPVKTSSHVTEPVPTNAVDGIFSLSESPPPTNPSAAARSAHRRAILQRLQDRRQENLTEG